MKGEGGDGDARTHHPTVPQAIPDWLYQSTVAMLKESGLASRFDLSMLMKPAVQADIDKCVGHKQTLAIAKEQRLAYVQKTALAVGSSTAAAVAFADATGDCVVLVGDNVDNVRSSVGLSEPCLQPLVIQDSANNFILDGNGKKVALVHPTIENQRPIDVAQFYGVDVGSIMALTKTYSDLHPTMKPDSRLMFNTALYVPVQSAERRSGAGVRQGGGGEQRTWVQQRPWQWPRPWPWRNKRFNVDDDTAGNNLSPSAERSCDGPGGQERLCGDTVLL